MAIALTRFEALCGFRPINELKKFLQEISELRFIIGEELVANFLSSDEANLQNALRKCFRALMSAPDDVVGNAITSFLSTLSTLDEPTRESLHADLVERLHSHYPGDVGVFGPFFFNYIILNPGDAIYLPANEPHAYLSGDCVECMACSDNVVRAGLTPKLKDIDTLCEMLSYICEPADAKLFTGSKEDDYTTVYKPSVPDFALIKIEISTKMDYFLTPRRSASICIVIEGKAKLGNKLIQRGSVFFFKASEEPFIKIIESNFLLFQAVANV